MSEGPVGWAGLDAAAMAEVRRAALAAAARLRLPLGRARWRGPVGAARGRDLGSSIELHDQRAYLPGDDPRHLHWAAYARTGQLLMKLFRAEAAPWVEVGFDASASMAVDAAKARRAVELLAWTVTAADAAAAPVRVWSAVGSRVRAIEGAAVRGGRWVEELARSHAASARPDTAEVGAASAADRRGGEPPAPGDVHDSGAGRAPGPWPWRAGGLRVAITDLLFPAEPGPWLAALAAGATQAVVLVPWSAAEAAPEWRGNVDLVDIESGTVRRQRVDQSLVERYAAAYRRHFAVWGEAARRRGIVLARVPAAGSLVEALGGEARGAGAVEVAA